MEDFRKQVKKTLNIYRAVLIAAFGTGVCASIITLMIVNVSRYSTALKNDEKLKKLYILETDERERLIYEKSNSSSFRAVIILLGLAAIIIAIAFVQAAFKFYYRRKY